MQRVRENITVRGLKKKKRELTSDYKGVSITIDDGKKERANLPKGDNRGDQSLSSRQFQTRLAGRNAQVSRKSAVDSGKESFRELP